MNSLTEIISNIVNGFLFGVGLLAAAAFMRVIFHLTICG